MIVATILFAVLVGWMIWKFYPILKRKGGLKDLFQPVPIDNKEKKPSNPTQNPPQERG